MPLDFDAIKDVEPVTGDIYALRHFNIDMKGNLVGVTFKQPISKGIHEAQCGVDRSEDSHASPDEDCSCGFYAFDKLENFKDKGNPFRAEVVAVVRLSGKIIICEKGVRAQRIEVVAIADSGIQLRPGLRQSAANKLGVPLFSSVHDMIQKFPTTPIERPETSEDSPQYDPLISMRFSINPGNLRTKSRMRKGFERLGRGIRRFAIGSIPAVVGAIFTFMLSWLFLNMDVTTLAILFPFIAGIAYTLSRVLPRSQNLYLSGTGIATLVLAPTIGLGLNETAESFILSTILIATVAFLSEGIFPKKESTGARAVALNSSPTMNSQFVLGSSSTYISGTSGRGKTIAPHYPLYGGMTNRYNLPAKPVKNDSEKEGGDSNG